MKLLKLLILCLTISCNITKPPLPTPAPKPTTTIKPKEVPVKILNNDNAAINDRKKILLLDEPAQISGRELETLSRKYHINWAPLDTKSFIQAQKENKNVLLYIKSNNIKCENFENNILSEKKISHLLNNNFISIKIDYDNDIENIPEGITKHDLPLLVFLNPSGEFIVSLSDKVELKKLNIILLRLSIM